MSSLNTCLWFDGQAEEAARVWCRLLPDSEVTAVIRSPANWPAGRAGDVLRVEFTLMGPRYSGLNGGPGHPHSDAVSLAVGCDSQAEIDRLWEVLIADGGAPIMCGWLKDRFGVRWQIVPERLMAMLRDGDPAGRARAFAAMSAMVKLDLAAVEAAYAGEAAAADGRS